jgi:hypothetical protein
MVHLCLIAASAHDTVWHHRCTWTRSLEHCHGAAAYYLLHIVRIALKSLASSQMAPQLYRRANVSDRKLCSQANQPLSRGQTIVKPLSHSHVRISLNRTQTQRTACPRPPLHIHIKGIMSAPLALYYDSTLSYHHLIQGHALLLSEEAPFSS